MSERWWRWPLNAALILIVIGLWFLGGRTADAEDDEYVYTAADTLAAIDLASAEYGVSARYLRAIVRCETAGTFSPYAVGLQGELGAVQLHPRGELPAFYRRGFDNPNSPYQAVSYLAIRLNEGAARAWACA